MGTRMKKEMRKTKNNMAKDCGKEERRGGVEDLGRGAVESKEQRKVEKRCESPMCHQARGGLVTGNKLFLINSEVNI